MKQDEIGILYESIMNPGQNIAVLPVWIEGWDSVCRQKIKKTLPFPTGSMENAEMSFLTVIPDLINCQLMIAEPIKSLLFFILEGALNEFEIAGQKKSNKDLSSRNDSNNR